MKSASKMLRRKQFAVVGGYLCALVGACRFVGVGRSADIEVDECFEDIMLALRCDMKKLLEKQEILDDRIQNLDRRLNVLCSTTFVGSFERWANNIKKHVRDDTETDFCQCVDVSCSRSPINKQGTQYFAQRPLSEIYEKFPYVVRLVFNVEGVDFGVASKISTLFTVTFEIQSDKGIKIFTRKLHYEDPLVSHSMNSDWLKRPIEETMESIKETFRTHNLKPEVLDEYLKMTERCLKLLIANWNDIKGDTFGY